MDAPRSLYFGPAGRESLAWLHASDKPARRGVIICSSFGREDLCIHRSLKHIAQHAAEQGLPALRFDYAGSGDSAGGDFDSDCVARWLASVNDAIDTLRLETGVSEVCLVGVRLGSLLAAWVARERSDVAGLVAIAPVTAGRLFVREMKAYALGAASQGLKVPMERTDGLLEAGGFAMDLPTQEALKSLDLLKESTAPAYPTLIIERDDLPADARWLRHLHSLGADARSLRVPGYAGVLFTLNYASLYYTVEQGSGLAFPGAEPGFRPHYVDFLYFSFTIAVALQTADVAVTGRTMRIVVLGQSVLSFVFNTAVLAFFINIASGLF